MPHMNDVEGLLRKSNPAPQLPEAWTSLATEMARSKVRQDPRRRLTVILASVIGGALLVGGGVVAATAQAGWLGADRYVDGPDMTGVRHVRVDSGARFDCTFTLHAGADYQQSDSYQKITNGVAEAHRYMRTLNPDSIKTDPSFLDPNSDFGPPDSTLDQRQARMLLEAWVRTVNKKVDQHLLDLRFPSVGMETISDCEAAPTK